MSDPPSRTSEGGTGTGPVAFSGNGGSTSRRFSHDSLPSEPRRVAILSDIHSNVHALDAVLDALREIGEALRKADLEAEARTPSAVAANQTATPPNLSPEELDEHRGGEAPQGDGAPAPDPEATEDPDAGLDPSRGSSPGTGASGHRTTIPGLDGILFLGDLVGYNADPRGCIERLRAHPHVAILGNHDWAATVGDAATFNSLAVAGVEHSRSELTDEDRTYLGGLPHEHTVQVSDVHVSLVHGSPYDPLHEYIFPQDAPRLLRHEVPNRRSRTPNVILLGHTHIPMGYIRPDASGKLPSTEILSPQNLPNPERLTHVPPDEDPNTLPYQVASLDLFGPEPVAVANPGSVGQPRDGDPRASFAVLDAPNRRITYHRVPYDVEAARDAIRDAGLPSSLGDRLLEGR